MFHSTASHSVCSSKIDTKSGNKNEEPSGGHMYEVGKKRLDGKYNVWQKILLDKYWWEWVVVGVFDSLPLATEFAATKNYNKFRRKPAYKVNQDA